MNIYHKALILESNFRPTLEISEPSDKTSVEMEFTSDPASFAIPAKGETANEGHHFGCLTLGFVGKIAHFMVTLFFIAQPMRSHTSRTTVYFACRVAGGGDNVTFCLCHDVAELSVVINFIQCLVCISRLDLFAGVIITQLFPDI